MRKFVLWNYNKTQSFDFNTEHAIISDVTGLGIDYAITKQNGVVTGFEKSFTDITFLVHFGVNDNPYAVFSEFAGFIGSNGRNKLILEYQANNKTLYCDVWIKTLPKTQKNETGVIAETISFERLTYWYTVVSGTLITSATIVNEVFDLMPINLEIIGATSSFVISLSDGSQICTTRDLIANEKISIDSQSKKVILDTAGVQSNGYNLINKAYNTFLMAAKGTYTLTFTGSAGQFKYSYNKWVID